ncbi:neprilysin-1-like [Dermacentor andersoni]|uniref:neprilysin-1-like n=1 Tax=Dermacentor andersoni TaxID=34620 RepID=UPI0021555926|nr:neprilysin-1-like [Dermacentor andersoni]
MHEPPAVNSACNHTGHDAAPAKPLPAADGRKSSLDAVVRERALSQLMSEEAFSGKADTIVVSVASPDPAYGTGPTPAESREISAHKDASTAPFAGNKSRISERNSDATVRSAYQRSMLQKQHGAVEERAWMDRRPANALHRHRLSMSCIVTFTAASTCILIPLLLTFYASSKRYANQPCMTPTCVEFAKSLQASMNASVQPCENFGRFVCDGWRSRHALTVREMAFVEALEDIGESLLSFVVSEKRDQQDARQKAAMLYRSCHLVRTGERNELQNVRDALRKEGIAWPRRSPTPDVVRTVLRLSLVLRWGAPCDVIVRSEGRDLVVQMEVNAMFSHLHDKFLELFGGIQEREAYFETLKSEFKASDDDVLDFDTVNDFDTAAFLRLPRKVQRSRYAVALDKELIFSNVTNATEQAWREALDPFWRPNKTSHLVLSTRSESFVRNVWKLWASIVQDYMYAFVSWSVVQIAALYANQQLQLNFYGSEEEAQLRQGASCLAKAFLIVGSQIFSRYNDVVLAAKPWLRAHNLISAVCKAFLLRLQQWKHFDASVVVMTQSVTGEMPLLVILNDTVNEAGEHVADMSDSLVRNIEKVPLPNAESVSLRSKAYSAIESAQLLVLLENDFALTPYAFTFPYFYGSASTALNYAGAGGIAAYALAQLFFKAYGASVSGNVALQAGLRCMKNASVHTLNGVIEDKVVTWRVLATKASLDAHEQDRPSRDAAVSGLDAYTGPQLFFMASCYSLCPGSDEDADDGAQCNAHLKHVDEFAQAFECAPGTPMNPLTKCSTM